MDDNPVILCVGRLYCDLVFTDLPRMPTLGTEVFAGDVGLHPGGGAPITAAHLAALGHRAALAATLPAAPFGTPVQAALEKTTIDLEFCPQLQHDGNPQLTIALVLNGDRAFVSHRAGAAIPPLQSNDLKKAGVAHLHIGEASTLVEHPDLIEIAHAAGATVSLDCSWDDDLKADKIAALLPDIDVFLPNDAEAQMLRDMGLSEPFSRLTVIKQGRAGATMYTPDGTFSLPAIASKVVDTTGAGDAFNAGFLGAWTQKSPLKDCLQAGVMAGANATTVRGGMPPGTCA